MLILSPSPTAPKEEGLPEIPSMGSQEGKREGGNGQLCWVEVEWDADPAPVSRARSSPYLSASPAGQMLQPQSWHQAA